MKIEANGISMNYEVTGSGDYLVLIHGAGDNLNAWHNQVPVFSKDYRVLTYDVRGHGQTELAEGKYALDIWTNDLYALIKALGTSKVYILGYSMGGMIAATLALKHPEVVKALVLSNTGGASVMTEKAKQQMEERHRVQKEVFEKEGMLGIFKMRTTTMFSPGFAEKNPDVMGKYRAILLQNRVEGYRKVMESMSNRSPIDFAKITCPTLIIVGEHDISSSPEAGKILHRLIPSSELKIFPTAHAAAMEQPEEYNKTVLAFLAKAKKANKAI
ncbi:alpha/beta fold hydrolase [Chloroflexota bacterium]